MSQENKSEESSSRLWLAVAISMSAIFSSYAISVFNHSQDVPVNAYNYSHRPVVVSYLA